MRKTLFASLFVTVLLTNQSMPAASNSDQPSLLRITNSPPDPDMPDVTHSMLVEHAAQSHALPADQVDWLSQGAWDEDHCSVSIYPPEGQLCVPGIPNGHHSWDPDTNQFWNEPSWWGDFGPGLSHAVMLFEKATNAYWAGNTRAAYLWLGRALHMLGDVATPAHTLLDIHHPLDPDSYEEWLSQGGHSNTQAWIDANPPGESWDMDFRDLPAWEALNPDLQAGLNSASQQYGGRASGQELWELGPTGEDRVIFQLMYLIAEESDNWDSDDAQGEIYPGSLADPAYLIRIREALFPLTVRYATALISYFEQRLLPPPAPTLISPLDGAWVAANPPVFYWQPVNFNPTYRIEVSADSGFTSPLLAEMTTNSFYTPATPLPPGLFYWRVHAETEAGTGEWSEVWSLQIPWRVNLPWVSRTE